MRDHDYNKYKNQDYNNQKFKDICIFIFNNKDLSYDEFFKKLEQLGVYGPGNLFSFLSMFDDNIKVIDAVKIIVKHLKNKKYNIYDKSIEDEFFKIGKINFEEDKQNKPKHGPIVPIRKMTQEDKDNQIAYVTTIIKEIISSDDANEVYEKYNITDKALDNKIRRYLKYDPELYVDYKMHKNDIDQIDNDKLEYTKAKITLIIKDLESDINYLENLKELTDKKGDLRNLIIKKRKILKQYYMVLSCFNLENTVASDKIKDIDPEIKKYALEITKYIRCRKNLNNNYMSDENIALMYRYFDKKTHYNNN